MISVERIKASDLMRTDVACLHPEDPIEEAVRLFEEYEIGGAPVIDLSGKLLGVLSVRDIARSEHLREGKIEGARPDLTGENVPLDPDSTDVDADPDAVPVTPLREDYPVETMGRATVADWMSPEVMTVGPKTTLRLVCQIMGRESIHRVFVVEDQRLVGVISALDVVRFLAEK